jgi:23S rRNA (pseudouridine1915-N3)-methyltransferase
VGKTREKYLLEGVNEYSKRLRKYAKVDFIDVKTEEQALKRLKDYVVVLDVNGEDMSSEGLADVIKEKDVCFLIGGAEGLSRETLEKADLRLSLSKMTFPHQMAKFILTEQVYRAFTILKGEKYHK